MDHPKSGKKTHTHTLWKFIALYIYQTQKNIFLCATDFTFLLMRNGVGLSGYLCVCNQALRKNPQKHNNCNWHKVSASILMMMLMMLMHNSNRLLASWLLSLREQCVECWHTYTTIIPLPQHTTANNNNNNNNRKLTFPGCCCCFPDSQKEIF